MSDGSTPNSRWAFGSQHGSRSSWRAMNTRSASLEVTISLPNSPGRARTTNGEVFGSFKVLCYRSRCSRLRRQPVPAVQRECHPATSLRQGHAHGRAPSLRDISQKGRGSASSACRCKSVGNTEPHRPVTDDPLKEAARDARGRLCVSPLVVQAKRKTGVGSRFWGCRCHQGGLGISDPLYPRLHFPWETI